MAIATSEKIVLIGAGSTLLTRGLVHDLIARGDNDALVQVKIDPDAPPAAFAATAAGHAESVGCVVGAARDGDHAAFVPALLMDGSMASLPTAQALAEDLLRTQARFLPRFGGRASAAPGYAEAWAGTT